MIWSRRDHRAYGTTILITGIAWLAVGLAVALARDLSLAAYLIKIFLPSSPALLDCTELARSHWRHATRREHAEQDIQDIWDAHHYDPAGIDPAHAATSRTPHTSCADTGPGYPASSTSSANPLPARPYPPGQPPCSPGPSKTREPGKPAEPRQHK